MKFLNIQVDELKNNSTSNYVSAYVALTIGFLLLSITLLVLSKSLFKSVRNDSIKDGSKLSIKFLSILMILYLTALQTPFTTTLL